MKLLFTFMHPRTCSNILPVLECLSGKGAKISCYLYGQMASSANWFSTSVNPKPYLRSRIENSSVNIVDDTGIEERALYNKISHLLDHNDYDLVITDVNKGKMHWGTPFIYQAAKRKLIPVIGCQEGSVDDGDAGLKSIAEGLGLNYDYCFCFGEFDKERLLRRNNNLKNRVFTVGLPGNDRLKRYINHIDKKHVLLLPSWTSAAGDVNRFQAMTDALFESCGIRELSNKFGLPILVKEKTRAEFAFKHLESKSIKVTMDELKLDQIVAEAACIVGAPSTLLFKGIQLGIPTAVLGKPVMGQLGVFQEFQGLTDSSKEEVLKTVMDQQQAGIDSRFIERAIKGSSKYNCVDYFVNAVNEILERPNCYSGKRIWSMGLKKGIEMRFPNLISALRSFKTK
jgi:hypothetical protein